MAFALSTFLTLVTWKTLGSSVSAKHERESLSHRLTDFATRAANRGWLLTQSCSCSSYEDIHIQGGDNSGVAVEPHGGRENS